MAQLGMDIDAALRYARTLEYDGANAVANALSATNVIVQELMSVWRGEDATRFDSAWPDHARNLNLIHSALTSLLDSLNSAIREQESTSSH